MAHRGEVKPDAPAGPLLPPGVVLPAAGRDRFTLARIASHWSLLPPSGRVDPDGGYKTVRQYTTEQMYTALSRWHFRPTSPNTEIHDISDFGTALLGHLLVRAGGEADYEQLLLKRFCSPLDLRDTRVTPSDDMRRRLAPPHDVDGAPTTSLPPAKTYASYDGIYSTADDLLRFIGASLGTGAPAGQLGVALKENLSRTATANGGQINTGYGWRLSTKDYVDRYYQGGPNAGYYAMAVVQPDQHWGLVLLTDRSIDDEVVSEVLVGLVARGDLHRHARWRPTGDRGHQRHAEAAPVPRRGRRVLRENQACEVRIPARQGQGNGTDPAHARPRRPRRENAAVILAARPERNCFPFSSRE